MNNPYETLSQALTQLKREGYTYDFNLANDHLHCVENDLRLHPEDFEIDKYYRFEGMTDPSDNAIVYAISSKQHNIKGVLVNAYGVYADSMSDALAARLNMR